MPHRHRGGEPPDRSSDLLLEIRRARRALPAEHRELLDELGVQEAVMWKWPDDVIALYRTLGRRTPAAARLVCAAAVWLDDLRTVAFNGPYLTATTLGLDEASRQLALGYVAVHEYGHALSLRRATAEHREDGRRLLGLLPPAMRDHIGRSGYRTTELFDEVVATVYELMVRRVREHGYGPPEFLHPDVLAAFLEVIPWPKIR